MSGGICPGDMSKGENVRSHRSFCHSVCEQVNSRIAITDVDQTRHGLRKR